MFGRPRTQTFLFCYVSRGWEDFMKGKRRVMAKSGNRTRQGLPDRWQNYSAVGDVIPGTRFVAFKVPLKDEYFSHNFEGERFTPDDLVERMEGKIGIVIDLSKKAVGGYYSPMAIKQHGIKYQKIAVVGRQVPNAKVVQRFYDTVKEFEDTHPSDKLIGVHCTHGVNRTGYLITRYMVEQLQFTADEALKAFEEGRGYPMERENYIASLKDCERFSSNKSNGSRECQDFRKAQPNRAASRKPMQVGVRNRSWAEDEGPIGFDDWRDIQHAYGSWNRGRDMWETGRSSQYRNHHPSPADIGPNWREDIPPDRRGVSSRGYPSLPPTGSHRYISSRMGGGPNGGRYPVPGVGGSQRDPNNWRQEQNSRRNKGQHQGSGHYPAPHHRQGDGPQSYHGNVSNSMGDHQHQHHKRASNIWRKDHRVTPYRGVGQPGKKGTHGLQKFKLFADQEPGPQDQQKHIGDQSRYRWTKKQNQSDKSHIHF